MNKGINKATGEWINFMNAGDTFHNPDTLSAVSEYLKTHLQKLFMATLIISVNGEKRNANHCPYIASSIRWHSHINLVLQTQN